MSADIRISCKDIDVSFVGQIRDKVNRLRYVNCLKDNLT